LFSPKISSSLGLPNVSVGDYLVASINPDIEVIRKRISGIRISERVYRLFGGARNEDIFEYVRDYRIKVASTLPAVPPWFDSLNYATKVTEFVRETLKNDPELNRAINEFKKKADLSNDKSVKSLYESLDIIVKSAIKDYEATKLLNAVQMLKSNVPKDYFYLRGAAQRAFITSMSILKFRSVKLESYLRTVSNRSFKLYRRAALNFKKELSPLLVTGRLLSDSLARTELYVNVCNSNNMESLFKFKPLLVDNLDKAHLHDLLSELEISLQHTYKEISALQREDINLLNKLQTVREFGLTENAKEFAESISLTVIV
jgi:hypothetical protein